jgi:hypothetical protein
MYRSSENSSIRYIDRFDASRSKRSRESNSSLEIGYVEYIGRHDEMSFEPSPQMPVLGDVQTWQTLVQL